ncbi:MAG: histidine kinase [Solirubrobacteraceae bacterium]|nr:histidine kinase [Solirubrobacteraceae bacterium]
MAITAEDLASIDLFDEVGEAEREAWAEAAVERVLEPGEEVADADLGGAFGLLVEGRLDGIRLDADGNPQGGVDSQQVAPTWMGAISVLTGSSVPFAFRAAEPTRIGLVASADFHRLIFAQRPVFLKIMRTFRPVISRIQGNEMQREKLASLGTMAAGLAHELNNPAAAARRSADQLAEAQQAVTDSLRAFVAAGVERAEAERFVDLHDRAVAQAAACSIADKNPLAIADREEVILEALEDRGVDQAWNVAPPLAIAGVDEGWIAELADAAGTAISPAVHWVAASLTARALADELRESTDRMSSLVGAMKVYAYMDQGDLVEVDVHEGLEATLTILSHKLKHTSIDVVRDYGEGLPRVCVYGSELNQVWTNLLHNAIQALGDTGTITVSTRPWNGDGVSVVIEDDGPGIPAELQRQVFDPFFTTKPVGEGTGLGLDTARRIVVDRHQGEMSLESQPGRTAFTVDLPRAPRKG